MRRRLPLLAALAATSLVLLLPAAPAGARTVHRCHSADLRYAFRAGQPRSFGVFRLRAAGVGCARAHRVAHRWMKRFEVALRAGHVRLPHRVLGYRFRTLRATEAQTYREQGRRGQAVIRFHYRVPNG